MITCKEDLINTYIENDFGELRDLYLAKCEDFGLKTGSDRILQDGIFDHYDSECFEVLYDGRIYFPNLKNLSQNSRKLILSDLKDLKPKLTKIEYEKVTGNIFDLRNEFERGELYAGNDEGYSRPIVDIPSLLDEYSEDNIYRRVEKEIDWREEVITFVKQNNANSGNFNVGYECEEKFLTDEQFLEMCRVALRATGELK